MVLDYEAGLLAIETVAMAATYMTEQSQSHTHYVLVDDVCRDYLLTTETVAMAATYMTEQSQRYTHYVLVDDVCTDF